MWRKIKLIYFKKYKNGETQDEGLYILMNDHALAEGVWDKGELKGGRIFLLNDDI